VNYAVRETTPAYACTTGTTCYNAAGCKKCGE